jgi:cysteine desulfurase/selenocysteine lyase
MYNTLEEVDALAESLEKIIARAKPRPVAVAHREPAYPAAAAGSPAEAAEDIADYFDFMEEDWEEKYRYLIEIGSKLPPMPDELKTDATRVHGCQSTVYMHARKKPGTADVLEFLADSDADIVRGELALLQRLFSGQHAADVLAFDVDGFMHRIGLDKNLTQRRRNGLAEMIQRVRRFAAETKTP